MLVGPKCTAIAGGGEFELSRVIVLRCYTGWRPDYARFGRTTLGPAIAAGGAAAGIALRKVRY
eukprot:3813243-Rhodomonas_salina.2